MRWFLKAKHLESKTQEDVKKLYSHRLVDSYSALAPEHKTLLPEELNLLEAADNIYKTKEFEYLNVFDAGTAYKRFPDLNQLADLARKITAYDA